MEEGTIKECESTHNEFKRVRKQTSVLLPWKYLVKETGSGVVNVFPPALNTVS
jgi:hypothetical protein